MLLTDYFRYPKDAAWDIAKQCGVEHGVIRLPETDDFDLTDKTHWQTVYDGFRQEGITPVIVEPMPNAVHDHIKAGDRVRYAFGGRYPWNEHLVPDSPFCPNCGGFGAVNETHCTCGCLYLKKIQDE